MEEREAGTVVFHCGLLKVICIFAKIFGCKDKSGGILGAGCVRGMKRERGESKKP